MYKKLSPLFLFISPLFAVLPNAPAVTGPASSATVQFGGAVPTTVNLSPVGSSMRSQFANLTIGNGTAVTSTPMDFRLRSNTPYRIVAKVTGLTGSIEDGIGGQGGGLKTGDVGFGIVRLAASGASVVNRSARTDAIAAGFDVTTGWPQASAGQTPAYTRTLHDLMNGGVQILSGGRISGSGDNSSDDNFLLLSLAANLLPQYFAPGEFSVTISLTITTETP